jgi:acetolactate synthase I/II/III large subunit
LIAHERLEFEEDMIKVTDYIAGHLASVGVRHVFMVTGGGAMHLNDSFGMAKGLEFVCNHHEQACAMAAEGYYRATGRLAAVNVTSGPGGTNALTGVISQWLDSIPCVFISGQVKQQTTIAWCPELKLRQLGDQEINIVDIVRPVTKYAVMVRDAKTIRYHLERALYLATHGRPGPTWLDVPLDIQAAKIEPAELAPYDPAEDEIKFDRQKIQEQVAELLQRFRSASRPVLMAGHGIRLAGAADLFIQLAEKLNVPVLTAICGHDLIWSDHPLFFGRPGICGDRLGNMVVQNSDFFLSIGARLGIRQISYNYDAFARAAFRAMVDIDPAELQKPTLRLHMPVHADARFFIEEMLRQLDGATLAPKESWLTWCKRQKSELPTILEDNPSRPEYANSYHFAHKLFERLQAGDLVVTGNGTAYTGTFQVMQIKQGVRVFTNQACAAMGYDLPSAIGACIARDKKPVILITGDGSLQMNIQELQTVAHRRLPVKIFVLNNNGYLAIRITQDTYFDKRHFGSAPEGGLTLPDIRKIAAAYGLPTAVITRDADMEPTIAHVLSTDGPCLCEVFMDPAQTLYPKLSSVVKPDGTMVSRPLEDMYPFLPREQFARSMIIPPLE